MERTRQMPRVSVITPNYNPARYLHPRLDGILRGLPGRMGLAIMVGISRSILCWGIVCQRTL